MMRSFRGTHKAREPGLHAPGAAECGFRVQPFGPSRNDAFAGIGPR